MAEVDILADDPLIRNSLALAPTPFERWAIEHQYDITPAVPPALDRVYADSETQAACKAWAAGAQHGARMLQDSTFETEAFREKMRDLAGDA